VEKNNATPIFECPPLRALPPLPGAAQQSRPKEPFSPVSPASSTMGAILFIIAAWATRVTKYLAIVAKPEVLGLHAR